MIYKVYEPTPELAPFVRFFWALECEVLPGQEFVHRSIADSCVELVFSYKGEFVEITPTSTYPSSPRANIQAQSTSYRRFLTNESFGILGVYLYPFALPKLFRFPAYEFTNAAIDLDLVTGISGRDVDERVNQAGSNEERVSIISDFLLLRLRENSRDLPLAHLAVHSMLESNGNVSIADLARDHALSTRQFERRFKEMAGLSPKLYSRVVRFQSATQERMKGKRDLTDIAYSCGYYDQSHFINDFREFSGYTPKEYFWCMAEGTQYMDG